MTLPTVADLLDRSWAPPAWPKGYACIYKVMLIGTTRAYVGKAVDLRKRFVVRLCCHDDYFDRALRKHGPENFTIEVLWVAFFCDDAYAQEDSFIEAHRTNWKHGGYNVAEGGAGWTSTGVRGGETIARRAGYPQRRVLAELEKGPRTIDSLAASLGFTTVQIRTAFANLRLNDHHILVEGGGHGLLRLITFEEAADDWASGRAVTIAERVLGLLMEGPRTTAELAVASGMPLNSADASISALRENGYNIESRGSNGRRSILGTYHLIIDHKRHPWLHLGVMDLRGAAHDDR